MKFQTSISALVGLLSAAAPVSAQSGYMPNIVSNCNKFHLVAANNNCGTITSAYNITLDQFLSWNPSVNQVCTNLWLDYYVCVGVAGMVTSVVPPPITTTTANATFVPPITTITTSTAATPSGPSTTAVPMPGVIASCKKYHTVASGDSCDYIAASNGITVGQFRSWNTYVDAGCTNLWLGYSVCVAA
ncbi:hypothetical protein QBC42DRAFT_258115 [Cladorrhinum samala]|uniref:LysM domain-containing protein n=1 Tax=Cladorrhinum samala TaxID=585594 RepID=A0AAV9I124_9PEZI|nr:hypothetical protein QBC42DRAFT_258115 [Cladorrhinum samala]